MKRIQLTEAYKSDNEPIKSLSYNNCVAGESWVREHVHLFFSDGFYGEIAKSGQSFKSELNDSDSHTSRVPNALELKIFELMRATPNFDLARDFLSVPQSKEGISFMVDYSRYLDNLLATILPGIHIPLCK